MIAFFITFSAMLNRRRNKLLHQYRRFNEDLYRPAP
jgi:hypothetical protein